MPAPFVFTRRSLTALLAVSLGLTACRSNAKPPNTVRPTAVRSTQATTAPDPEPAPASRVLQKPGTPTRTLVGTLTFDAGYMARVDAGRALEGAYAVADAALIANNAGNIISDNGAGILSDNGGGLISNNGSAIISDNGAGLTGKVKFGLLQSDKPSLGQELPTAGMLLGVVDLKTGQPVPVGVDGAGKPIYVVHSDARGHYQLYVPEGLAGNLRVLAQVPGTADRRLRYDLVTRAEVTDEARFDEAAALGSDYVRSVLTVQLFNMTEPGVDFLGVDAAFTNMPAIAAAAVKGALAPMRDAARDGSVGLSHARKVRALQKVADRLISGVDFEGIRSLPEISHWPGPGEPAMATLRQMSRDTSAFAAKKLAQDPNYFERKPYVLEANRRRADAGLPAIAIRRPSDFGRFLIEEYASSSVQNHASNNWVSVADIGMPPLEGEHMRAVFGGILVTLLQGLFVDEASMAGHVQALKDALAAERGPNALPEPPTEPVATRPFQDPPEAVYEVVETIKTANPVRGLAVDAAGTVYFSQAGGAGGKICTFGPADRTIKAIAGSDAEGKADGPAAKATFGRPGALALTADGTVLYIGDATNHCIRKLVLAGDGSGQVSTLAGASAEGQADGPGAGATFETPYGLALDGKGGLIVADLDGHHVRRVNLEDANLTVSTLVGDAPDPLTKMFPADGDHTLDGPAAVVFPPQGDALVLECFGNRVWQMTASGELTYLAGGRGYISSHDGFQLDARFDRPIAAALDRDGTVLVLDTESGWLRRLRLHDGGASVTTLCKDLKKGRCLAVAPDGTIYVGAETPNIRIVRKKP